MTHYLLDTNHLSAALNADGTIRQALREARLRGDRVGTCVPALCELQAGLALAIHREHNEHVLRTLLGQVRVWPLDFHTARVYGDLYHELRRAGRALSQVDIMLAALARRMGAVLLSSDRDFEAVSGLRTGTWVS